MRTYDRKQNKTSTRSKATDLRQIIELKKFKKSENKVSARSEDLRNVIEARQKDVATANIESEIRNRTNSFQKVVPIKSEASSFRVKQFKTFNTQRSSKMNPFVKDNRYKKDNRFVIDNRNKTAKVENVQQANTDEMDCQQN